MIRIFLPKKMYLYLVFNKAAYRSLLYIDIILFVKTIFDFKPFSSRISGEWNRISGQPDIWYNPITSDRKLFLFTMWPFYKIQEVVEYNPGASHELHLERAVLHIQMELCGHTLRLVYSDLHYSCTFVKL